MKKVFSLCLILLVSVGCTSYVNEDEVLKKLDVKLPETAYGIKSEKQVEAKTYYTGECYYTFYKNNKEVLGLNGKSNPECLKNVNKLIESDIFLNKEEKEQFNKEKIINKGTIINNYLIKIDDKEATIIKRRIPTTPKEVIKYFQDLGLDTTNQKETFDNINPEQINNNYYYNKISFSDAKTVQEKVKNYKNEDELVSLEVMEKSLSNNLDNSIEVFRNEEQLEQRYNVLKNKLDAKNNSDDYLIKKNNFLLVLSIDMSKEQAEKYKDAFNLIFKELV